VALALAADDVRQRRPPPLSFLLRLTTLRQIARIVSLLAVDYVGLAAALFTALIVKTALQGSPHVGEVWRQTERWVPFAYLVTALMFARLDLYAARPRQQGLAKVAVGLSRPLWPWSFSRWQAASTSGAITSSTARFSLGPPTSPRCARAICGSLVGCSNAPA
jgi:hypothetical protein